MTRPARPRPSRDPMDRAYWDAAAADYDGEIHDSLASDASRIIRRRLRRFSSPGTIAGDFGCGVGKYVPLLARRFAQVHAIDLSPRLIEQAKLACGRYANVTFHEADLTRRKLPIPRCDFAVCANVLITPDATLRHSILRTIHRHMKSGSHLLTVIPSTESALYTAQRLAEWNRREGVAHHRVHDESLESFPRGAADTIDGVIRIDGVPTKHYLREEAAVLFAAAGFDVATSDKVEYPWSTEFARPPKWMGPPLPWDWLIVARRA